MSSFKFTNTTKNTTAQTLTEGDTTTNPASDDSGSIDSTSSLIVASGTAVNVNLAVAPVGAGVVLTNAGTLTSQNGRTIDTGSTTIVSGAKLTINNASTGTITNAGGASGNDDAIRINADMPSGTFLLYNSGSIVTTGNVNDSVGVRLGKVYTASVITIDNGIDASGNINTSAVIKTADADAIRPGGVDPGGTAANIGSSTITNYGTISASDQLAATQITKDNGIDIGGGQQATVINYGTIIGDESGLGSDNSASLTFAPTYYVTNNVGATITGNNGPGIAIGNNSSSTATSTTSVINNFGTITGKALGVGRTLTGSTAPAVTVATGTGIYSAYAVTITNGSSTNATATIQGSGAIGTPTAAQTAVQGGATYDAINAASGAITNYGVITETTATAAGAAIDFTSTTVASTVTNYGTITGAAGVAIQMGGGNDTVNLYTGGTITGKIDGGAGTDTLTLNLGPSVTPGTLSNVANFDILSVAGGGWTINDTESYGNGVTIASGATLTLGQSAALTGAVTDNGTLAFSDTGAYTAANAIGGTGAVTQAGSGTLTLSGTNTYSGGTNLNAGTLDVASSAGTGAVRFGTGAATLDIEQSALTQSAGSYRFGSIANIGSASTIDVRGTGTETGATFNAATNQLTLSGAESVVLQLDATSAPASGYAYGVTSDNAGGTNIALDQIATVTGITATPSSGYATSGQAITISIAFSKAVQVSGTTGPVLMLSDGGTATYDAAKSTATTLVFDAQVAAGQNAAGVQITSIANVGTVQDAALVPVNFANAINQAPVGPIIDASTPSVTIANAGGLTNQATQTITGSVDTTADPETAGTVVTVLDGTTVVGSATVTANGSWSTGVTLTGDGQHVLTATDTDKAGNAGTSGSVTYTLDTATPNVAITNATKITNQATQTISGTVDTTADPQTAGTIVTVLDGSTVVGSATVAANGGWSTGVTLTGDGQHVLTATDTDKAGNTGTSSAVTYTLDTATPAVAITNAGGLTNQPAQTISGTVNTTADPQTAGTVVTVLDGSTVVGSATVASNGSWTTGVTLTGDGQHQLTATDTDNAGNRGTSTAVTYTLDTATPNVAITSAGGVTNQASQTVTGTVDTTADPQTAGTLVTVLDGSTIIGSATVATDGSWSASVQLSGNGQHTLTATDTDKAGNAGTSSAVTYTLDTNTPTVHIANAGGLTNQPAQTISGTVDIAADPQTVGTIVTILDGSTVVGSATVASNGSWGTSVTLVSGQNVLSATDTDKAGNAGTSNLVTYTLDTATPAVHIANAGGLTNQPAQTISGTVDTTADPQTVGTIVTVLDGTSVVGSATVASNGSWSTGVTLTGDGQHALTATDTDKAGNAGTSGVVTYTLDTATPTVTITNAGGLTNQPSQTISGTVDTTADPQTAGTIVTVLDGTSVVGSATVAANGSWSTGATLANGQNVLTATDTDNAGNKGTSGSVTYTLDTATPNVAISNANTITNQAIQTISGTVDTTADPQTAGTIVTVLDGSAVVGSATVAANGAWNTSVTLANGQNVLTATDTDNAGNKGTSSAVTYTLDTATPNVVISNAGGLTNQATQTISGTVDTTADPQTAGTIVTVLDGSTVVGSATVAANGSWSTSVTLSNGQNVLTATDTDKAGNKGTSNAVSYTLDTATPNVAITNTGAITNQASQTISGTVDTTADPQTAGMIVTVLDGTTVVGSATVAAGGGWSTNVTLANGQNVLTATDTDKAGNKGTSASVIYTLDTATPSVTITNAGGLTNQATQTISGTVNTTADPQTAGTIVTVLDGSTVVGSATVAAGGAWSTNVTLGNGQNVLTATDTDKAGNKGTSAAVTYTVDTATPSVVISNTGGVTNQASQTISGTVDTTADPQTAGTVVKVLDGSTVVGSATVAANGSWSTSVTLTNGQNVLTATDTDKAGNKGTSSAVTYTLGTGTPNVVISNGTTVTNQATQTISGTVNTSADPQTAGTIVSVLDGNTVVGSATVAANGSWSTSITLASGQNVLTATDTDQAGNKGTSAAVTYTLDTTPPTVAITSPGGAVGQAVQTISGTVDIADAGTTVTVYEGTTALGTALVGPNGAWGTSVTLQAQGANTLIAKDTDTAGNVGSSSAVSFNFNPAAAAFTKGNLVIGLSGDTDGSGNYTDNQATPVELEQITTSGAFVNDIILPQATTVTNGVTNYAFSGEYGSSSEGTIELSGDGKSIVIAGYDVNAAVYNTGGAAVYGNAALAQSTSLTNQTTFTPVGRVIADISSTGAVDTSTLLYNVYNTNNPRSVATINGSSFYISGQGVSGDTTQGVFLVQDGSSTPTAIYKGTDTRTAEIYNGVLYVSTDSKQPKNTGGTADIASYGGLPTTTTTPTILNGISQSIVLTAAQANTINGGDVGTSLALDPENFFFANSTTLYVADGGIPKQGGDGDGGLQKWTYNGSQWVLQYTLSVGLNIVAPGADAGTTGLIGLTGKVVGNSVLLYATNQTVGDLDQKYVYAITDQLNATSGTGESFTQIVAAPADTNIRGISFAPSTQAPVVTITSAGGLTNQATHAVSGTVDVADAGTTVIVMDGTTTLGTALVGLDGTWSTNVTLSGDGTHALTAVDTDQYGNTGTSTAVTYTLDTATPNVHITSAGGVTNQAAQTISGMVDTTADPQTAGTIVTILDGSTVVGSATVAANGSWSTSVQLTGDGQHSLTATDTDEAGNGGTSGAVTYTLDTATPSVHITTVGGLTNQANQVVSGTVDTTADPQTAGTIVTVLDGTTVVGSATVAANGSWSTSVTLANGQNVLTAADTDTAGNVGTSAPITDTLDTATPNVAITSAGSVTNQATQAITGTVDTSADPQTAGTIVTVLDGTTVVGSATVAANGSWSTSVTLMSDGQHVLTATDTDKAGNKGTSTSVTYTLDTATPKVAITSTGGVTSQASQTIVGTVDTTADPQTAATIVDVLDGNTIIGSATVAANGSWTTGVQLSGNGQHSLTATDTDAAGNIGTSGAVVYTLDTNTPTVHISSAGGLTNQATQTISGTVDTTADPQTAGTIVTVLDGSTVVGSATVAANGAWSTSVTLAAGQNVISATDTDNANTTGTSNLVTYTLDTATPNVAITSSGGLTNQASQTISGTVDTTADPQTAGTIVTVLDGSTVVGSATVAANGSWSTSVTLANGQNVLTAMDTDQAGNTGMSASVTYTLDTATPHVTITSAGGVTNQASQTILGTVDTTADPQTAGTTVSVLDGNTVVGSATVAANGSWTTSVQLSGDGQHSLTATDTDMAGNPGTSSAVTYTLDTATPNVTITNAGGLTNQASQTISGSVNTTADPQTAGTTVTVLDGSTVVGSATVAANGSWSTNVTLSSGQNVLTASDTDMAGNPGTSSAVTYTLDTATPNVAITSAGTVTNQGSQTIAGTVDTAADPQSAGTIVTVLDGSTVVGSATVAANGNWSTGVTLANGQNVLTATDTDKAGNTGTSGAVTYTLDTATPNVAITSPSGLTAQPTQTITGTVDTTADPQTAGTVVAVLDGSTVVGSATVAANGSWSTSVTLANGQNVLTAMDTDQAGNTGTSSAVTYTLDTTVPSVTITSPGGVTNQASQTVSGTVDTTADPLTVGTIVSVLDGSAVVGSATVAANGTWTTAVTLANGQNVLTATDNDGTGTTGTSAALTYTLATATPNVAITTSGLVTNQASQAISGTVDTTADPQAAGTLVTVLNGSAVVGSATVAADGSWSAGITLANGQNVLTASDTDQAGNVGSSGTITDTLNTTAPVVTASATTPTTEATSDASAVETFAARATDPVDGTADPITFTEQLADGTTATVRSGATFAIGTHTIVASATDTAGNTGSSAPFTFVVTPESVAEDGYIVGATVFADANGNGQLDPGEVSTTTDAQGKFSIAGGSAPLVLFGGTDSSTGVAFSGTLQAPANAAIVSPLTTIVQIVAATQGISAAAANASILASLGLPAGTDLTTLDAQAGALAGNAAATAVFAAQAEAANVFSLINAAGGSLGSAAAQAAIASAFTSGNPVLTNAGTLTNLATSAGVAANAASAVGQIGSAANTQIATAAASGASPQTIVANVTSVQTVTQGSAATSLTQDGNNASALAATTSTYTGANLGQAVASGGGSAPVQNVDPSLFGAITHDVTSPGGNVYALYEAILGHAPDAVGFETDVAELAHGGSLASIAQDLLSSSAYRASYGRSTNETSSTFVDQLYADALHRQPSSSELQGWDRAIAQGETRAHVAVEVARSAESHADLASVFAAGVFVPNAQDSTIARLYYGLLDRQPDATGLASLESEAQNGLSLKAITRGVIQSAEYVGLHGSQSNAQFVEALFEGAYGRTEGAGGAEGYLHELNAGASRAAVALSIVKSQEAIAHLSPNIETGFHVA